MSSDKPHLVQSGDSYSDSGNNDHTDNNPTWVQNLSECAGYINFVHNFAEPGSTAELDLAKQIASLSSEEYILGGYISRSTAIWMGINDCVEKLYLEAKVRLFLFVDVPPMDRTPGALHQHAQEELQERCRVWNDLLYVTALDESAGTSSRAMVLSFSSYAILSKILDDPTFYGFSDIDVSMGEGNNWEDMLHLRSNVHAILGKKMYEALKCLISDHT
ncbi:hypothetical protein FRC16_004365 [Serendipita sp. 398]|nr:hypothetical protein FRC16_004365 [Serendipita sp. 398]